MGTVIVENVRLEFGAGNRAVLALDNVSLSVPDKQFAVIVGPSGCGKSSLLDIVAGLKRATSGICTVDGENVTKTGPSAGYGFSKLFAFPVAYCAKERRIRPIAAQYSAARACRYR